MAPDAQRLRIRHVTSAGTTLALSLAPLVIGVLFARSMALDPHTPVNALITRGGRGGGPGPAPWRGGGPAARRPGPGAGPPLARPKNRFPRVRRLP